MHNKSLQWIPTCMPAGSCDIQQCLSSYLTHNCSEHQPGEAANARVLVTTSRKHTHKLASSSEDIKVQLAPRLPHS